jgi:hypothetical protein
MMTLFQIMFDEVLPLFAKAAPPLGLGFDSEQIGYALSISGLAMFLFTTLCVPMLVKRFGKLGLLKATVWLQLPVYVLWPLNHYLVPTPAFPLLNGTSTDSALAHGSVDTTALWISVGLCLSFRRCCSTAAFTCVMVLVNNSVDSDELGAVNGMGQALAALARAVGPALGGALWSVAMFSYSDGDASASVDGRLIAVYCTNSLFVLIALAVAYSLPASLEKGKV